jgi:hypothetical protein
MRDLGHAVNFYRLDDSTLELAKCNEVLGQLLRGHFADKFKELKERGEPGAG